VIAQRLRGTASAPSTAASLGRVGAARSSEIAVTPERVDEWLRQDPDLQLIDVRERYERDAGHIAGSRHIELTRLASEAPTLDAGRPIVFYCRVGSRSTMAAQALRASGVEAYSMDGGLVRWEVERRPLAPDGGYVADH
jgi:rhodanese-related sulfurtransferase